ncbi:gephyrin-like molybdotransferase Glp [Spirulina sp. 06S082]|uniref:molybdopterin molybdotransferase MoeA n=1 Tax=Spirulina sp. 06S082 TaxID=3110248 RepID=UPI002B20A83F|nr:gephyrin-like molybdotransferase Glp [Spirulina sp. 06S082]MEA5468993.1 gephyrin-like molybdotransferase Glp [Spirulina sp. 06S082]
MLSVSEAEAIILDLVQPLEKIETVTLENASRRILAHPVSSPLDFPYWDNSAMDGYAVRYEDLRGCDRAHPKILKIIEEIPAGIQPQKTIASGEAARIFTGAVMPQGADTIVMQENTQRDGDRVTILQAPGDREFVRHKGAFYRSGNALLGSGIAIGAPEIAVLATAQCTSFSVYRRPRVAIFSTGNELIAPGNALQPGQIVDSNQYALRAFVSDLGAIPVPLGIVRDRPEDLEATIKKAIADADIVLSTGGVSVGEYDYIEEILAKLGGKIYIRSVAVKPGKPLTVATFEQEKRTCLYFGIPGNPVSALVSCWRFVQPALKKLSGLGGDWQPKFVMARSRHNLTASGRRETYLWGRWDIISGGYEFSLAEGDRSSGNLMNLAQTNGLAIVPVGETAIAAGEKVCVMLV